jgi:hypothetical protein
MIRHSTRVLAPIVGFLIFAGPALAGPPLLCHPFDIAKAPSLPWDGTRHWWQGRADYNLQNLVADTEALLTPSTPVIVRMETLRRAAIYASQDERVASQLLAALTRRATEAERLGKSADSMAFFDAGYLAETFRQITHLGQMAEFRTRSKTAAKILGSLEGRTLLNRSLSLRPADPALQFAAALVAASTDRRAYVEHAEKARKGAAQDALLARNLHHIS